jgi:NADPH-dependent ferric siderophore reductase
MGPGGGGVPEASEMILAGDETALPAIARIAARVPAGTRLRVFLEIDGPEEEQPIASSADIEIEWLHRNGVAPGKMRSLERLIRRLAPECAPQTFIWAGCEKAEAVAIREYLKDELQYDRQFMRVGSYWEK